MKERVPKTKASPPVDDPQHPLLGAKDACKRVWMLTWLYLIPDCRESSDISKSKIAKCRREVPTGRRRRARGPEKAQGRGLPRQADPWESDAAVK